MATIIQKVLFTNTTCEALWEFYMDAGKHSMITDGPVEITDKVGTGFNAFGGYISGKNLHLIKNKLIVQSWRGSDWNSKDPDSALLLAFEQKGNDVALNIVHANVPDDKEQDLDKGWYDYYWDPWKQLIAGQEITRPEM